MIRRSWAGFLVGLLVAIPATLGASQVAELLLDARPFACTFNTTTQMALCGGGVGPNNIVTTEDLDEIVGRPDTVGRVLGTIDLHCVVAVPYETPDEEIADAQRIWCAGPYESSPER